MMPIESKLRARGFRSRSTRPKEIEEVVELSRRTRGALKGVARKELDELREEMSEVKGQVEKLRRVHRESLREVRMKAF